MKTAKLNDAILHWFESHHGQSVSRDELWQYITDGYDISPSPGGVSSILSRCAKSGVVEVVPGTRPWRYKRVVGGPTRILHPPRKVKKKRTHDNEVPIPSTDADQPPESPESRKHQEIAFVADGPMEGCIIRRTKIGWPVFRVADVEYKPRVAYYAERARK